MCFPVYIRIYFKYWWKLRCVPYTNDLFVQVANLERKNVLTKYRSNVCARPTLEGLNRNSSVDILRPRQNGRHIADDIFGWIFLNENVWISIKIPLKFVAKDPIKNMAALVQIMARRRPGDKPLSEPMMVCLLTHICTTQPHFVNVQREHAMRKPASHISMCALLHSGHLCSKKCVNVSINGPTGYLCSFQFRQNMKQICLSVSINTKKLTKVEYIKAEM